MTGNGGGGKSVLARHLGALVGLPVHEIDDIQWIQPGWVAVAEDEVRHRHDEILSRQRWLIDGWGPWDTIESRFAQADTIIVVDMPLWRHYLWATRRALQTRRYPVVRLYRAMWKVHHAAMPRVRQLMMGQADTRVVYLRTPREIRDFINDTARQAC